MSDCLWPHGVQQSRLPCPSPTPGTCSNSCPLSRWCHPTTSSSVTLSVYFIPVFRNWTEAQRRQLPPLSSLSQWTEALRCLPSPAHSQGRDHYTPHQVLIFSNLSKLSGENVILFWVIFFSLLVMVASSLGLPEQILFLFLFITCCGLSHSWLPSLKNE